LAPDPQPVGEIEIVRTDRARTSVDAVLDDTFTDGVVVVQDGRLVHERYVGQTTADTTHLLMSISKSIVGCVAGILVARGMLSPEQLVSDHVPEVLTSGYRGATVRHLLDMRSGIKFSEEYTDPHAEVRVLEQAARWSPLVTHGLPDSTYPYLATLVAAREHGGAFEYRSCETDVLGWVCERAAGRRMAPLGAAQDAEITCDVVGTAMHDGGVCATTADLARFGVMLLDGGRAGDQQVVPEEWLRGAWTPDDDIRGAFAASTNGPVFPGGWYRNQFWFSPRPLGDVLICLGINGQMLYVNPGTRTVAAKTSSWPVAQSPVMLLDTLAAFDAVAAALTGREAVPPLQPGPPGVAAGVSRRRATA
jgi:CubicO group peptidase (beta-lactamase class C family)